MRNLVKRIRSGESAADIAADAGVTPSAIYLQLRRSGHSIRELTAVTTRKKYRLVTGIDGVPDGAIRALSDGTIQSCLSPRSGELTEDWHTRNPAMPSHGRGYPSVRIGGQKNRRRLTVSTLIRAAWGDDAAAVLQRFDNRR